MCSGRQAITGVTDIATTNPELARQAVGWDPSKVTSGSSLKLRWRCGSGHEWTAVVASRTAGNGCPYCAGKKVLPGLNDLATTDPDLAKEAVGWDPTALSRGAPKKRLWRCDLGHEWEALVSNRATKGHGCPVCSGHRVLVGYNDLATTDPLVAAEAHEWDPTTLTRSSNKRQEWRCALGHIWSATVAGRTRGFGCPVCAGKVAVVGFNDLAHTHPEIAAQACGWDPTTVTHGSDKRLRWRCELDHEWVTGVSNRVGGKDCPTCATYGFDGNAPAWLYLMEHPGHGLLQIGITNSPSTRLKKHEAAGWYQLELIGPMEGHLARSQEASILKMIRSVTAAVAPFEGIPQFDGYTECWIRDSYPVASLNYLTEAARLQ
jgi:hypothetical protein